MDTARQCSVESAAADDIDAILQLAQEHPSFAVDETIIFYERSELEEWIKCWDGPIILVAKHDGVLVGFCCCFVVSSHWALIDNFLVHKNYRRAGFGDEMMKALMQHLRSWSGIKYISCLIPIKDVDTKDWFEDKGFEWANSYDWFGKELRT